MMHARLTQEEDQECKGRLTNLTGTYLPSNNAVPNTLEHDSSPRTHRLALVSHMAARYDGMESNMHMPDDVAHAIRFVLRMSAMIGERCTPGWTKAARPKNG
jgi:hypothetical protein